MNFAKIKVNNMGNIVGFWKCSQRTVEVSCPNNDRRTNLDICKMATFRKELARVPLRTSAAMANPAK
jgi:hypothetical protein